MNNLYTELACAFTGADCPATAAWLEAYLRDTGACQRAALHWQHAGEELRDVLASQLGFTEPNGERWPVPLAIQKDYEFTLETAAAALA